MSDRLDYNFGARLGASAKEAKDAFLEAASRAKDEPGQTAQGALKGSMFDVLGAPADIGYLAYDLLANPEVRRARMEAREPNLPAPEERFLSSDYIADKFGFGYEDEEQFGRLFAFNPIGKLRSAAGLGIKKTKDERQGDLFDGSSKPSKKIACGDCFGWSFDTFAKAVGSNENVKLHRGKVLDRWGDTSAGKGNFYDHAWIEKDGRFYDWQTSVYSKAKADGWSKEEFEDYFQPKEVTVFGNDPGKDLGFLIRKEALYRPLTDSEIKEYKNLSKETGPTKKGVDALSDKARDMNKSPEEIEAIKKIKQANQEMSNQGLFEGPLATRLGNDVSLYPNESKAGRKLLVVGCCKTKTPDSESGEKFMPAEKRYVGELFKVLKKRGIPKNVDVAILSAKDGLIHPLTPIENYDVRMNPKQKEKLLSDANIVNRIKNTVDGYDEVFVAAGQDYRNFLDDVTGRASYKTYKDVDNKVEGMGDQKRILGNWIKNEKSRFEGIGGLDKTAKNMQEISFTERFKEKTQDVLDRSKKDVLDADLENEAKFRLEVQSGLFPLIDSKSKGMDTEKIKKDVFNTLQKLIDSRVYKDVMGDRYYEPVVDSTNFMEGVKYQVVKEQVPNITKEGELEGYTTVKKPKLKVRFRELKPSTASREAKPATSRFIDLDGLEEVSKDELPATFIRRAQGGGVSSLNELARTMNYR